MDGRAFALILSNFGNFVKYLIYLSDHGDGQANDKTRVIQSLRKASDRETPGHVCKYMTLDKH